MDEEVTFALRRISTSPSVAKARMVFTATYIMFEMTH
jgi:hypothetical protein